VLPPYLPRPPIQPMPPPMSPTPCLTATKDPLPTVPTATALMTGAVNHTMPASSMSCVSAMAQVLSHWPNLPGMRLNCHEPTQDHLLSRRINCLAASLANLPSRRLNCLSATSATNPYITQCVGYRASRLVSPFKHLAVALWIRACYGLGPHSLEGHYTSW